MNEPLMKVVLPQITAEGRRLATAVTSAAFTLTVDGVTRHIAPKDVTVEDVVAEGRRIAEIPDAVERAAEICRFTERCVKMVAAAQHIAGEFLALAGELSVAAKQLDRAISLANTPRHS